MSIENRVKAIIERFNQYTDWEDRYRELIKIGKTLPAMDDEAKAEKYKITLTCESKRVYFIINYLLI